MTFFYIKERKEVHLSFLNITHHAPLTDKMVLHYFELPKLPSFQKTDCGQQLWLMLFNAETEEELAKIEELEVPIMKEAIKAYRHISASPEFREIERLRSKARHDEAQALKNAKLSGYREADEKWQGVVADKDAVIADKDAKLADKDALISELRALLAKQ